MKRRVLPLAQLTLRKHCGLQTIVRFLCQLGLLLLVDVLQAFLVRSLRRQRKEVSSMDKSAMNRIVSLFILGTAALTTGCGEPLPPLHPLTLVFPPKACKDRPPPCVDYTSCYDLGIRSLLVTVGPSHPEDTKIFCMVSGPSALTGAYYQPGQGPYLLNATYTQNAIAVTITAGPFDEDESSTPWTLQLQ